MIVDDHAVVRIGLSQVLNADATIHLVGEAADCREAVEKAAFLKPDIILMDMYMPGGSGLEAMLAIKKVLPNVKVVFLTISDHEEDLFQALKYGAHGYLLKSSSISEVVQAVKLCAVGESMLSPRMATRLISEFRQKSESDVKLSRREVEILDMVGDGITNNEIASRLFIAESTVRTHLQRLLEKLHLKNRAEAIAYAQHHSSFSLH
jgi:DNA-binding NarL/FixJ family response regulator